MKHHVKVNLKELVQAGIITHVQLEKIELFQQDKHKIQANGLLLLFGILGATLIGLGVILIIAHNWDNFPKYAKTCLAFLPLIIGQILCLLTLIKKSNSIVWREVTASLLFFGIGASIAMVSQIYHIQGSLGGFILLWMVLALPMVYIMRTSAAGIMYTVGSAYYLMQSFDTRNDSTFFIYIGLVTAIVPYYLMLWNKGSKGMALVLFHWMIPISLIISVLKLMSGGTEPVALVAALFLLFYELGVFLSNHSHLKSYNSYLVLGMAGVLIILFIGSFTGAWSEIGAQLSFAQLLSSYQFWISMALWSTSIILFYYNDSLKEPALNYAIHVSALGVIPLLYISGPSTFMAVLFNVMILWIAITSIIEGFRQGSLAIMNLGMCILSALIIIRFFDFDVSFIVRGVIFVCLGIAFFISNYYQLKLTDANE